MLYGHGGGGGHGGGHGGGGHGGGGNQWQYMNNARTVWGPGSYDNTPLVPFMQYEDHAGGSFIGCMSRGINYCDRSFTGEGFRACIHGMLMASDLLPGGVNGGIMDVDGGFAAGLQMVCPRETIDVIPRAM